MHTLYTKVVLDNLKLARDLSDIARANVGCKPDSKYSNAFIIYRLME